MKKPAGNIFILLLLLLIPTSLNSMEGLKAGYFSPAIPSVQIVKPFPLQYPVIKPQYSVHKPPPENFNPKFKAAGCFLKYPNARHQDKVLLLKRHPLKVEGNTWGIPGGKLEKGESPIDTVIREVFEETGLSVNQNGLKEIGTHYIRLANVDFTFFMFQFPLSQLPQIILASEEHQEFRWVTVAEALDLPLMTGEIESFLYYDYFCKNKLSAPEL